MIYLDRKKLPIRAQYVAISIQCSLLPCAIKSSRPRAPVCTESHLHGSYSMSKNTWHIMWCRTLGAIQRASIPMRPKRILRAFCVLPLTASRKVMSRDQARRFHDVWGPSCVRHWERRQKANYRHRFASQYGRFSTKTAMFSY